MKVLEKISLEKIRNDRKNPIVDFGVKDAVITHYLHNNKNGVSQFYISDAIEYTKEILKNYVSEDYTNYLSKSNFQLELFNNENVPFPTPQNYSFKFIDLFAGIGGFRLAMQNLGGKCVFTSEWDKQAQKTYRANFGETPFGDITKEETKQYIPDGFDVLCAGFPCQAFSIAGNRKGFADTRGTLFFDIEQIIVKHKPKVVFLENVKNLVSHDNGNTFKTIISVLEDKLGY